MEFGNFWPRRSDSGIPPGLAKPGEFRRRIESIIGHSDGPLL